MKTQVARIPNYQKGKCMSEIEKPESRHKKPETKHEKRNSKLLNPEGKAGTGTGGQLSGMLSPILEKIAFFCLSAPDHGDRKN